MNHIEVITRVAEQTGISSETCEVIVKAFEKQTEEAFAERFKGIKNNKEAIVTGVHVKTGCGYDDCQAVITAVEAVLETGLSDKFRFLKRNKRDELQ